MARKTRHAKTGFSRRALRIALCVAITSQTGWLVADDGSTAGSARPHSGLPVYPFSDSAIQSGPMTVPGQANQNSLKGRSSRHVSRLLGVSKAQKSEPTVPFPNGLSTFDAPAGQPQNCFQAAPVLTVPELGGALSASANNAIAPTSLPTFGIASASEAMVLPTNSKPDQLASENVQSQANLLPTMQLAVGSTRNQRADSYVMPAAAIEPPESVEASLSDSDEDINSMVDDLLNSVDPKVNSAIGMQAGEPVAHSFSDSVTLQVAEPNDPSETDEHSVMASLSDRVDSNMEHSQVLTERQPQLVKPTQSKTVRTEQTSNSRSSRAADSVAKSSVRSSYDPTDSRGSAYEQSVPRQVDVPAVSLPAQSQFENTIQQSVTSRRENQPAGLPPQSHTGAMPIGNLPIAANSSSASKTPLVPMLANNKQYPTALPKALQSVPASIAATSAPVDRPESTKSQPARPSQLRVSVKDSVTLSSVEPIRALSVEHEDICQVLQSSDKTCSVIGLREGETRVALISEVNGQRQVQVHQVTVGNAKSQANDSGSLATGISQTISQLYPKSRVKVSTRGSQLVVGGTVDSNETAKKILSLVRKTTLSPVVDELQVR